jgi:hypothetical protein
MGSGLGWGKAAAGVWGGHSIEGALDAHSSSIQDVGVDLCGSDAGVAEEFLHGSDVVSVFEEMGGKGVAPVVQVTFQPWRSPPGGGNHPTIGDSVAHCFVRFTRGA